jgi:alkylation response protein AidB-like acyl-CoA dehydrogenase
VDIDDTPEEAAFRAEARDWLDAHAIPKGHPDDFSLGLWTGAYDEETYVRRCQQWQRTLFDGGWAGITWPKAYGGRGGRPIHQVIFNQEQARYGVSNGAFMISIGMAGPTILAHGSDEQKDRFLPPMLRGDEMWCQLFSEPDAGSDLASLRTCAVREGDDYVLTGHKVWTSYSDVADWCLVLARTDPDVPRHEGISAFRVSMRQPGVEQRPLKMINGITSEFGEVLFDGARVPASDMIGAPGEGWKLAMTVVSHEREPGELGYGSRTASTASPTGPRGRSTSC